MNYEFDTQVMLTVVLAILAWELINYIIARIKQRDQPKDNQPIEYIGLTPETAHLYGMIYCHRCRAYHTPNYGHKP